MKRKLTKTEYLLLVTPVLVLFLFVWKFLVHQWYPETLYSNNGSIASLAFSPDGRFLATASVTTGRGASGAPIQIWDRTTNTSRIMGKHQDDALALAFSPDGKIVAIITTFPKPSIQVWNVSSGQLLHSWASNSFRGIAFSPNGKEIAVNCGNQVQFFDFKTGNLLRRISVHLYGDVRIVFSPDGATLAGATDYVVKSSKSNNGLMSISSSGENIILIDAHSGKTIKILSHPLTSSLAFSADGKYLAAKRNERRSDGAVTQGHLSLYDVRTMQLLWTQLDNSYSGLAFSPDSRILATENSTYGATLRAVPEGHVLKTFNAPDFTAGKSFSTTSSSLAFSPDGKTLACTDDQNVKLWDIQHFN